MPIASTIPGTAPNPSIHRQPPVASASAKPTR